MLKSGQRPFHNALRNVESSAAHSSLFNAVQQSQNAYDNVHAINDERRLITWPANIPSSNFSLSFLLTDQFSDQAYCGGGDQFDGFAIYGFSSRLGNYQYLNFPEFNTLPDATRFYPSGTWNSACTYGGIVYVSGYSLNLRTFAKTPALLSISMPSVGGSGVPIISLMPRVYSKLIYNPIGNLLYGIDSSGCYVLTKGISGIWSEARQFGSGHNIDNLSQIGIYGSPYGAFRLVVSTGSQWSQSGGNAQVVFFDISGTNNTNPVFAQTVDLGAAYAGVLINQMVPTGDGIWCQLGPQSVYFISSTFSGISLSGVSSFSDSETATVRATTNSFVNYSITGSVVANDQVKLTVTDALLPTGSRSVTYTAHTGDTTTTIATALASSVNIDPNFSAAGIWLSSHQNIVTCKSVSPNTTNYSFSVPVGSELVQSTTHPNKGNGQIILSGGPVDLNDMYGITVTDVGLGGSQTVTYLAGVSDSLQSIASALASSVNINASFKNLGIYARNTGPTVDLYSDSINTTTFAATSAAVNVFETYKPNPNKTSAGPAVTEVLLGGSVTANDIVALQFQDSNVGTSTVSYKLSSIDTLVSLASSLASGVNANSVLSTYGITATAFGSNVAIEDLSWGNSNTSINFIRSGVGSEVITFASTTSGIDALFSGSVTANDTVTLTFSGDVSQAFSHVATPVDTLSSIASSIQQSLSVSTSLSNAGISSWLDGTNPDLIHINLGTHRVGGTIQFKEPGLDLSIAGNVDSSGSGNLRLFVSAFGGPIYTCDGYALSVTGTASSVLKTFSNAPFNIAVAPSLADQASGIQSLYGLNENGNAFFWMQPGFYDSTEYSAQNITGSTAEQGYQTIISLSTSVSFTEKTLLWENATSYSRLGQYDTVNDSALLQDSLSVQATIFQNFTEKLLVSDTPVQTPIPHASSVPPLISSNWRSGLYPLHDEFKAVESGGSHSVLWNSFRASNASYQSVGPVASSFHIQGYQYRPYTPPTIHTLTFTELISSTDIVVNELAFPMATEQLRPLDFFSSNPVQNIDPEISVKESFVVTALQQYTEKLLLNESASAQDVLPGTQQVLVNDTFALSAIVAFTEKILCAEGSSVAQVKPLFPFDYYYGMQIPVQQTEAELAGLEIDVAQSGNLDAGIEIDITSGFTLVPVSNATSVDNPFQPTLAIGGAVVFQNASNPAPSNLTGTSVYYQYVSSGLSGATFCNLWNFGFNLDYNGGRWEASTNVRIGTTYGTPDLTSLNSLGQQIQFFGLNAAVTQAGRMLNNSARGYSYSGQFGEVVLNRSLNMILYGNQFFAPILLNPYFRPPSGLKYQTCKQAALALVRAAKQVSGRPLQIIWSAYDGIYNSTLQEAGHTGLDALSNLARRVGAVLRWDGNFTYRVAYPDTFFGTWIVPDCRLIAAGGLEYDNYFDLEDNLTLNRLGTYMLPTYSQFNPAQINIPIGPTGYTANPNDPTANAQPKGSTPAVVQLAKIKTKLTSSDPPLIYDLPFNYDKVYVQILVAPGQDLSGNNLIDITNYMTNDAQQWFTYATTAGLAGQSGTNTELVYTTNIGGALVPQVQIDYRAFPQSNTAIDNGNFVFTVACTLKGLPSQTNAQNAAARDLYDQNTFRFVKIRTGRITTMFFGSIPLPGMWASATVDDLTVSGIIENVQFTYPGFITVDVAQYVRITLVGALNQALAQGGLINTGPHTSSMFDTNPRLIYNPSTGGFDLP